MTRKPFIAANWKMHKTSEEAVAFFSKFAPTKKGRDVAICGPFTLLHAIRPYAKKQGFYLGAQNMHPEKQGAFTGEVSPLMLKDAGCDGVILGHSERRTLFGETDEFVNQKVRSAIKHGLGVILCVGENAAQRKANKTFSVVKKQLVAGLSNVNAKSMASVCVAYEPLWAIGTGNNATPAQAEEVHAHIRDVVKELYTQKVADALPIIYGGSVNATNVAMLMKQENIDGVLVGGASLDPVQFSKICDF